MRRSALTRHFGWALFFTVLITVLYFIRKRGEGYTDHIGPDKDTAIEIFEELSGSHVGPGNETMKRIPARAMQKSIFQKSPVTPKPTQLTFLQRQQRQASQERDFYFRRRPIINKFDFKYTLIPSIRCTNSTSMVIFVPSRADSVSKRDTIRETWGSVAKQTAWPSSTNLKLPEIKLFFVLGIYNKTYNDRLKNEQRAYNDLVQFEFQDSYHNLTLKSIGSLKFVLDYCPGTKYMLKVDDDTFVNIPYIYSHLQEQNFIRSVFGHYHGTLELREVRRKKKASTSKSIFPLEFYPPFAVGPGYGITRDIVEELFQRSHYVKWFTACEDAYITGVLRRMIGGVKRHMPLMQTARPCDFVLPNVFWATNYKHASDLRKVWSGMKQSSCLHTTKSL